MLIRFELVALNAKPAEPVIKLTLLPFALTKLAGVKRKLQSKETLSEINAAMVFKNPRYWLPRIVLSDLAK